MSQILRTSQRPRPDRPTRAGPATAGSDTVNQYLLAAALQQTEMICYFLEAEKVPPDLTRDGKPTAACYAALKRNVQLLDYLLERGASVHYRDGAGLTPLHYAALGGCDRCAAALVARGARLDAGSHHGYTPLALCPSDPRCRSCYELLRRYGARRDLGPPRRPAFH